MKKFLGALIVVAMLSLSVIAHAQDTTTEYVLTVSSRTTVYDTDGTTILGWRMEAQSGTHYFYLACMNTYSDCWPLNPDSGNFYFHYMSAGDPRAYPVNPSSEGSMDVRTGDGTHVVLFYWSR